MSDKDNDNICDVCDGDGEIPNCADELCITLGECIHANGRKVCRACRGSGVINEKEQ